ncbi:hypothetical protein NPX13_g4774 [Xylaria arbuscula]|uniref:Uncharacterized protein n=1 Tax=Xylaria arbuscula TaxID=114810 RepID=A0A9W8NFN1_9PEZI|nr:hypothetical protein NPX13_g4774 [Xylaria arbuscula]
MSTTTTTDNNANADNNDDDVYAVAFDPLDGSSIIGPNWSVGSILGVWEGRSAVNQDPRKQVAAVLGVFGPRTAAVVAVRIPGREAGAVCLEVGLSGNDGRGGLVPDVVHALVKGHGVYLSPVTAGSKAKLRRAFELLPVALIVECAGGKAIDPANGQRILETPLANLDEKSGLVCGTAEEVEKVKVALLG